MMIKQNHSKSMTKQKHIDSFVKEILAILTLIIPVDEWESKEKRIMNFIS